LGVKNGGQTSQQATKGLAKYGRTEVIFGICNSVVLWFGAGHLLFSF
jgi:hypothetical protein